MVKLGPSAPIVLMSLALTACSLVSLDALQEVEGSAGSAASTSAVTTSDASATTGAGAGSQVASSSAVTTSSSGSTGPGAGGSGAGGEGGAPPTGAYAAAVLADGPIAYLRLDEEAGDTTAEDSVGPYDGVLDGTVTWREPGAVADGGGASIRFDGSTGALILGDVLDFPDGAPFSIELWAKRAEAEPPIPALEWIFSKEIGLGTANRKGYCLLLTEDLRLGAEVWFGDGEDPTVAYKSSPTPIGAWHHLVVTGSAGALLVYVDGLAHDDGGFTTGLDDNDGPLIFGAQAGVQNNFDGWLDEIAVYGVELTATQIAAHLAAAQ